MDISTMTTEELNDLLDNIISELDERGEWNPVPVGIPVEDEKVSE